MGFYINPNDCDKEDWLMRNIVGPIMPEAPSCNTYNDNVAVCLVDNGPFTAAAIAYSPEELLALARYDGRPKLWFWIPSDTVAPFLHGQRIISGGVSGGH